MPASQEPVGPWWPSPDLAMGQPPPPLVASIGRSGHPTRQCRKFEPAVASKERCAFCHISPRQCVAPLNDGCLVRIAPTRVVRTSVKLFPAICCWPCSPWSVGTKWPVRASELNIGRRQAATPTPGARSPASPSSVCGSPTEGAYKALSNPGGALRLRGWLIRGTLPWQAPAEPLGMPPALLNACWTGSTGGGPYELRRLIRSLKPNWPCSRPGRMAWRPKCGDLEANHVLHHPKALAAKHFHVGGNSNVRFSRASMLKSVLSGGSVLSWSECLDAAAPTGSLQHSTTTGGLTSTPASRVRNLLRTARFAPANFAPALGVLDPSA